MGILQRLSATLAVASGAKSFQPRQPYGGTWWQTPAGSISVAGVGDGTGNSAVVACLEVLANSFAEATPRQYVQEGSDAVPLFGTNVEQLLLQPNRFMVWDLIASYMMYALGGAGDAYLAKLRSASGRVVELWPLNPTMVEPVGLGQDTVLRNAVGILEEFVADPFIATYRYTVDGDERYFQPSDLIHLRLGMDPDDFRRGRAPLKAALREVLGDEEAGKFATVLLQNFGVPGLVFSAKSESDEGPSVKEAKATEKVLTEKFGGANRGKLTVMSGGAWDVKVVGWSPEQMDFKALRRLPEERIAADLGVPAILAGLGAGLDRSTYNNASELREFFTESKVSPMWVSIGRQLTNQLLPDFTDQADASIRFDISKVRALQEDENKKAERWTKLVQGTIATQEEGRKAIGLPAEPDTGTWIEQATQLRIPTDAPLVLDSETPPVPVS